MAKVPIVAYGHPILKTKCVDAVPGAEASACIQNLKDTLPDNGLGMAAPQINVPLNIFILRASSSSFNVFINPKIIKVEGTFKRKEGCLSIPGIYHDFYHRAKLIEVRYLDENFQQRRMKLRELEAVVVQHECDHLNGVNFIDYMTEEERAGIAEYLAKIEAGEIDVHYDMLLKSGETKSAIQ